MKLAISILQKMFCKYLCNRNFLEKYNKCSFCTFILTYLEKRC